MNRCGRFLAHSIVIEILLFVITGCSDEVDKKIMTSPSKEEHEKIVVVVNLDSSATISGIADHEYIDTLIIVCKTNCVYGEVLGAKLKSVDIRALVLEGNVRLRSFSEFARCLTSLTLRNSDSIQLDQALQDLHLLEDLLMINIRESIFLRGSSIRRNLKRIRIESSQPRLANMLMDKIEESNMHLEWFATSISCNSDFRRIRTFKVDSLMLIPLDTMFCVPPKGRKLAKEIVLLNKRYLSNNAILRLYTYGQSQSWRY